MHPTIYSFSLQEIADWTLKKGNKWDKPHAEIPKFQRGLVWNPAQIEVLWDSLLRGIPIGVFSFISAKNSPNYGNIKEGDDEVFWLLDGQQRANAISLGYQKNLEGQENNSILWIDLLPDDNQKKRSNRKYFFYLTTIAQPWGYKINDANGENRSEKLSASERRAAMDMLNAANTADQSTMITKPCTKELFPIMARCPIPFALFREYYEKTQDSQEEQSDTLLNVVGKHGTLNHVLIDKLKNGITSRWNEIKIVLTDLRKGMVIADHTRIMALVAPDEISRSGQTVGKNEDEVQRDSDIAVYFTRLNRGGTRPSDEELNYSILKSIAPALANIDDLAEKIMHPARLANIAMLCYISLRDKKWANQIYRKAVYSLAEDRDFTDFVSGNFANALKELHLLLGFDKTNNNLGIPPVVLTAIARNHQAFYQMLLMLVYMGKFQQVSPEFRIGFTTLVIWFGNSVDFAKLYLSVLQESEVRFDKIAKLWIFEMIQAGKLFLPPATSVYDAICDAVDPQKMQSLEKIYAAWNPADYYNGTNRIWYWNQREAREMLLYVCRDYMGEFFGSYDPASAVWNEDSCPWDYDHIFPQSWVVSGQGNRQGKYHDLVSTFLNCFGNISPLHFSLNRSKNSDPPGDYFNLAEKLFITPDKDLFYTPPSTRIEHDETGKLPYRYASVIAQRLRRLYNKWYEDLNIDELLDFGNIEDVRRKFFLFLETKFNGAQAYYVLSNGKQERISCTYPDNKTAWARPWIACGVEAEVQSPVDANLRSKCLLCIASNGKQFEIGLRRHPDDDKVYDNGGRWWFDRDCASAEINETLEMLRALAKENNIQLIEKYY